MKSIQIGRLLRGSTSGFVVGCRVANFEADAPSLGALVRAPLGDDTQIYGLISDIHIEDDGLVRQLVTAEGVDEAAIADNRQNRTVPVEISVLAVGYQQRDRIYHLLPPRPPLSLDVITLCDGGELRRFTSAGRFGYFRHVLRSSDLPAGDILAAHIRQAQQAHAAGGEHGWAAAAAQELITLLRDDYSTLMSVLSALSDVRADFEL
jgi:hypothetical protein